MELSAATSAFVPGLLSDQIVWEPLAEQLSENAFPCGPDCAVLDSRNG